MIISRYFLFSKFLSSIVFSSLFFLLLIVSTKALALKKTKQSSKPNIILILADDWGWTDWQMKGQPEGSNLYETPQINQLAKEGLYFSRAYAQALCSPSRGALMTGKYVDARLGLFKAITHASRAKPKEIKQCKSTQKTCWPESLSHLPLSEITLAEELKNNGYKTFHFGKWHLGNSEFFPKLQGFEQQFAVGGASPGRGGYFAPYQGMSDLPQGPDGEYITERLTDEVVKTIRNNKKEPFFLYLAHYNVHSPYEAKQSLEDKYKNKLKTNKKGKHQHPTMAAMIESLDQSIGSINKALKEEKLENNTIVILVGDNGGVHWENSNKSRYPDSPYKKLPITSNSPLRCGKACLYEGGVRVPLIIKYPAKLSADRESDTPVHLIDIYPTLLSLSGSKANSDKDVVDGIDLTPIFDNQKLANRTIFSHFPRKKQISVPVGASSAMNGNYKLYRLYGFEKDGTDRYELFDLAKDPSERQEISAKYPKITAKLKAELNSWLKTTHALMPRRNPNYKKQDI